ncbi:MAG: hypothetical protein QW589_02845 [Candidatus Bathyarchaeia archaeon]
MKTAKGEDELEEAMAVAEFVEEKGFTAVLISKHIDMPLIGALTLEGFGYRVNSITCKLEKTPIYMLALLCRAKPQNHSIFYLNSAILQALRIEKIIFIRNSMPKFAYKDKNLSWVWEMVDENDVNAKDPYPDGFEFLQAHVLTSFV